MVPPASGTAQPPRKRRDQVTIRFAGDAGDGMQLAGAQFTIASALAGNGVFTLPDFPAEIRAPAGALAGVSGFQIHVGNRPACSPGDSVDVLVAMNPAALKTYVNDMTVDGLVIVNADAFFLEELQMAGYAANPLEDGSLSKLRVLALPLTKLNRDAVAQVSLTPRESDRCRNFFALGLVFWLFERSLEPTLNWIRAKFAKNPAMLEANSRSLKAGYSYGDTTAAMPAQFRMSTANLPPGKYRSLTGTTGLALGLVSAARMADLPLVFACCPAHPATELMHAMADLKQHDVRCPQAEDEIAALGMALGATFGGALGVTASSGPGLSLQSEALGLAVMAELPCVVIDLQRGGPSTGLPTKTEQSDLLQALFGRHGECPLIVVAPSSPADCFSMAYEAVRLAIRHMTPVVLLSDLYLAIAAEPWRIPAPAELPAIDVRRPSAPHGADSAPFLPFGRDERLARPWAVPGTPGLEHQIGGLEKEAGTGHVSYDPLNHEQMIQLRARKIMQAAADVPNLTVHGPEAGGLLVLGWGSTKGAIDLAVERARAKGLSVAAAHLRYLNPLPKNTKDVLNRYRTILVPELNSGQLSWLLRAQLDVKPVGLCKVQGRPFLIREIEEKIDELLSRAN